MSTARELLQAVRDAGFKVVKIAERPRLTNGSPAGDPMKPDELEVLERVVTLHKPGSPIHNRVLTTVTIGAVEEAQWDGNGRAPGYTLPDGFRTVLEGKLAESVGLKMFAAGGTPRPTGYTGPDLWLRAYEIRTLNEGQRTAEVRVRCSAGADQSTAAYVSETIEVWLQWRIPHGDVTGGTFASEDRIRQDNTLATARVVRDDTSPKRLVVVDPSGTWNGTDVVRRTNGSAPFPYTTPTAAPIEGFDYQLIG